MAFKMS